MKNEWKQNWHRSIRLIVMLANVFLVLATAALLYVLVGDKIEWQAAPRVVSSSQERKIIKENPNGVKDSSEEVINSIHQGTGLVFAEGFDLVRGTCTGCHSAQLITQNRATRAGWESMIRWMQRTQGLWDLGDTEGPILDYLAAHYAPTEVGRRANLDVDAIEWFVLELE